MAYTSITAEYDDHICTVTLNRPPMNSIDMTMREDLDRVLTEIEGDENTRVLVITGAGEKCFCSGMDVADVVNLYNGPQAINIFNRIDRFSKPVIAALNGHALGGGCELALACHFRLMAETEKGRIGCPELNLGITPGWGGIQRLPRLLGRSKALELILFSKRLTAKEALDIGLVNQTAPAGGFSALVSDFARALAARPPLAVRAVLTGMVTGLEKGIDEGLKKDLENSKNLALSEDAKEGITAFMQKREPVFTGK